MGKLLRLNDYKKAGSLTGGCPAQAIAARYDLTPIKGAECEIKSRKLNGAIDGKVTSLALVRQRTMNLVSGPTNRHGIPAFDWNQQDISDKKRYKMQTKLSPQRFGFKYHSFSPAHVTPLNIATASKPKVRKSSPMKRRKKIEKKKKAAATKKKKKPVAKTATRIKDPNRKKINAVPLQPTTTPTQQIKPSNVAATSSDSK